MSQRFSWDPPCRPVLEPAEIPKKTETYPYGMAQYKVIRVEELTQASEVEGELAVADQAGYHYLDSFVLGKHATIILRRNDPQR